MRTAWRPRESLGGVTIGSRECCGLSIAILQEKEFLVKQVKRWEQQIIARCVIRGSEDSHRASGVFLMPHHLLYINVEFRPPGPVPTATDAVKGKPPARGSAKPNDNMLLP